MNWTPEFMGFGNQLYLWAWAHAHRDEEPPHRVLIVERSRYWLPHFPAVLPYLVEGSDVSLWDRRDHFCAHTQEHSGDPRGFTNESSAAFVRDWLLTSPALQGAERGPRADDGVLTLNLRRRDFYDNPWHRSERALDLDFYVKLAVLRAIEQDVPSDAPTWSPTTWTVVPTSDASLPTRMRSPIQNSPPSRSIISGT